AVKEIGVTAEGEVYLYLYAEDTWQVYRLSDEVQETDENTIRFANLTSYDAVYEETRATVFSHKHPDTPVIIEKGGNDEAAFRDRIMAELAAGKGPDLMWVTMEDMEVLQEKGILMDLELLISKETLEQIFPGVLASGTVDGTLYGLFFDGCPKSFMVSDEIWSGNTWTVEDICSLLEEHKEVGDIYGAMREYTLNLFTENIRRCPFLDMDAGESYFEGEAFIRLLEYIKEFGDKEWEHTTNACELLKNRELLVAKAGVRKLSVFSRTMADCEAYSCHLVGLPGNDSDAGVWSNHEFLVVNSKTPHGEAVGKLFEYLLSEEAQKTTFDCSVRADVIRNTIRFFTMPDGEIIGEQSKEGNEVQTLVLKEDNTTYVEEYIEFLNRCEPSPYSATQIQRIIRDILLEYLNDQYSAERAAEIIDNRVQLYLDEQK
ncbi:MAG: carbohydrate ABC transporter substrate-binding protein, partial [Lachnospiraceae bacterium]|nr:carbohydrate ABC transporter substrate-binding protein [Lachnospiraceae bacterium]